MSPRIRRSQLAPFRRKANQETCVAACEGSRLKAKTDHDTGDVIVVHPSGSAARMGFDDEGYVERVTTPLGRVYGFENNSDGRLSALTNPAGHRVDIEYAKTGAVSRLSTDGAEVCSLDYDEENRLTQINHSDGTNTQFGYDESGAVTRLDDRCGHRTSLDYAYQVLIAITDANGRRTTFDYGEHDLPDQTVFPDGSSESYAFNPNGRLEKLNGGLGPSVTIQYDDSDLPTQYDFADGDTVNLRYDEEGRVVEASNGEGTVSFEYDDNGRVVMESREGTIVGYEYDESGVLQSLHYPGGETVRFEYDADGRLTTARDWDEGAHRIVYDADDCGHQIHSPNGLVTRISQAPNGAPTALVTSGGYGPGFSFDLEYDDEYKITSLADSEFGNSRYSYDPEGRLLSADGPGSSEQFEYDGVGNRISSVNGPATFNTLNQLTSQGTSSYDFDAQGNMTSCLASDGEWELTFNARNLLILASRPGGQELHFSYDAFGRRISKRNGRSETRFYWAGEHLIAEATFVNGKIETHREYLYRPRTYVPLAVRIDGKVYTCHTDHLGVPRRLTDHQGSVVWRGDFSAFGEIRLSEGKVTPALSFPGMYRDEETGLCYNRFRYYSPTLGRYISADPLGFLSGPNFYSYVDNNPITRCDPFGLVTLKGVWESAVDVASSAAAVSVLPFTAPSYGLVATGAALGAWAGGASFGEALDAGADAADWAHEQTKGFFKGVYLGVGDMISGLVDLGIGLFNISLIRACYDFSGWKQSMSNLGNTLLNIATNPLQLLTAIIQPITDAWGNGNYGEALGRVFVEVADVIVGAKGAGKLSKLGKLAKFKKLGLKGGLEAAIKFGKNLGMEGKHLLRLQKRAAKNNELLIIRGSNPDSLRFHGLDNHRAKPLDVKLKTAKPPDPDAGLVKRPKEPISEGDLKNIEELESKGWKFDKNDRLVDSEGNKIYGDHDLQGVYKQNEAGKLEQVDTNDKAWQNELNEDVCPEDKMFEHGANDNYKKKVEDPVTGEESEVMGRQPDADESYLVVEPDGTVKSIEGTSELKKYYDEQGLDWPYGT